MSKNKLIARTVEYYGNAVNEIVKANSNLDKVYASLKRASKFLEDQERLMTRFNIDLKDVQDMQDEVNSLLKKVIALSNDIDDVGVGIEMRQEEYQNAM